jgi:hypothetical protein
MPLLASDLIVFIQNRICCFAFMNPNQTICQTINICQTSRETKTATKGDVSKIEISLEATYDGLHR